MIFKQTHIGQQSWIQNTSASVKHPISECVHVPRVQHPREVTETLTFSVYKSSPHWKGKADMNGRMEITNRRGHIV